MPLGSKSYIPTTNKFALLVEPGSPDAAHSHFDRFWAFKHEFYTPCFERCSDLRQRSIGRPVKSAFDAMIVRTSILEAIGELLLRDIEPASRRTNLFYRLRRPETPTICTDPHSGPCRAPPRLAAPDRTRLHATGQCVCYFRSNGGVEALAYGTAAAERHLTRLFLSSPGKRIFKKSGAITS
jgi:hypothetical protein